MGDGTLIAQPLMRCNIASVANLIQANERFPHDSLWEYPERRVAVDLIPTPW